MRYNILTTWAGKKRWVSDVPAKPATVRTRDGLVHVRIPDLTDDPSVALSVETEHEARILCAALTNPNGEPFTFSPCPASASQI